MRPKALLTRGLSADIEANKDIISEHIIDLMRLMYAVFILLLASMISANCQQTAENLFNNGAIDWFPKIDPTALSTSKNADFIPNLTAYQQTTDYTCGPAALLSLAKFYGWPDIEYDAKTEMQIAQESGTRDLNSTQPGTKPQEMVAWLEKNGFDVLLEFEDKGDSTALQRLRDNILQGIPTLVEWIDLSGHWAIAVGYDYRNASDPWDDVLILADPYDRYDDYCDGYSFVNANRFYWMWFDALYFDNITWRTMITATPKKGIGQCTTHLYR
ncbi:MAG: Peptidase like family protein [Euryarchaeota archaeon]|nr:Peptidase like family protein [Euryarchaeota archaeon]